VIAVDVELLTHIPAFQHLPAQTLKLLADSSTDAAYHGGEILFQQGDDPSSLFVLTSGRVKLFRQSKERVQILALPMIGECFGAETLPNNTPCPYTVAALTAVDTLRFEPAQLHRLLVESPEFQEVFLTLVAARLKQFVSLVHDLAFRDVTARLAAVLVTRAKTEGKPTPNGIIIPRLLSQQEFAEMVGTAREVVYRTFKKFEQEGLARFTRETIEILALDMLTEIAHQEMY
jgi:CRP-like cAMP-binding protein